MSVLVWMPVTVAVGAALAGSLLSHRLPPKLATFLLTVAVTSAALAVAWALTIVILAFAMQVKWIDSAAGWCDVLVDGHHRVPALFGILSTAGLLVGLTRMLLWLRHRRRTLRALRVGSQPVEIIPARLPTAFAVPGRPGQIIVSQGMLDVLEPAQRRALIAHEQAHLDHRHHRYVLVAEAATRAVPLLHPLRRRVHFCTERWADEVAAGVVGDRRVVASAITQAALSGSTFSGHGSLNLAGEGVAARVTALLRRDEPDGVAKASATASVMLGATVALMGSGIQLHHLLALAFHVCQR